MVGQLFGVLHGERMFPRSTYQSFGVTRRKLQTPGTAEEHKRRETPTINPIIWCGKMSVVQIFKHTGMQYVPNFGEASDLT